MGEQDKQALAITVGDQTFRVRIAVGEEERYRRIAQLANGVLKEILDGGVIGGPRALAMAVFELAVELDEAREALKSLQQNRERLSDLIHRIDRALRVDFSKANEYM